MKIGYTTGVYDMFHIGHLNLLRKAKECCDKLIVGVTTDELSLSRKSKAPVIPFAERCEIVGALKYVDEVVPQGDMDKMAAQKRHQFNIMFVGDDWKGTPQWETLEKQMAEVGVEIIYFPYTQTTSSTKLRQYLDWVLKDNGSAIFAASSE